MKQRNFKEKSNLNNVKSDVRLNGNIYLGEYEERRIQALLNENNISIIGRGAFRDVIAREIVINKGVKLIEPNAFLNSDIETLMVLGAGTKIERLAFRNCNIKNLVLSTEMLKRICKVMDDADFLKFIGLIGGKTKVIKYERYLEVKETPEEKDN